MPKSPIEQSQEILEQIKRQISKGQLVEKLATQRAGQRSEVVEHLVHRQQLNQLNKVLSSLHVADVARVIENLSTEDRLLAWKLQAPSRGGAILLELSDSVAEQIAQQCDEKVVQQVLGQMDADDLRYLDDLVPQHLLKKRLDEFSGDDRDWVNQSLQYDDASVGALMDKDMVVVQADRNLGEVVDELRQLKTLPPQNDKLIVVDRRGHLVGILPWHLLVISDPKSTVADVMAQDYVTFSPDDPATNAARAFERYDLVSAPVVNSRRRPIGRLTVDEVMDFVREDIGDDVLNSAGLKSEEDLFAPVWHSARNRWMWLSISLLTVFLASRVIGLFEQTIASYVALAALMPIVAAIGGNTGNQTTTLVVRGLALDQINQSNVRQLIGKELRLSLLNGVVWGSVVGLFAFVFYHDVALMGIIALSMMLTMLLAAVLGLAVPLSLQATHRDPALGSSVLVTALTDSMGFFIFLGLAAMLL